MNLATAEGTTKSLDIGNASGHPQVSQQDLTTISIWWWWWWGCVKERVKVYCQVFSLGKIY